MTGLKAIELPVEQPAEKKLRCVLTLLLVLLLQNMRFSAAGWTFMAGSRRDGWGMCSVHFTFFVCSLKEPLHWLKFKNYLGAGHICTDLRFVFSSSDRSQSGRCQIGWLRFQCIYFLLLDQGAKPSGLLMNFPCHTFVFGLCGFDFGVIFHMRGVMKCVLSNDGF